MHTIRTALVALSLSITSPVLAQTAIVVPLEQNRTPVPVDAISLKVFDCSASKWGGGFVVGWNDCNGIGRNQSIQEFIRDHVIAKRYQGHEMFMLERTTEIVYRRPWTVYYVHLRKK